MKTKIITWTGCFSILMLAAGAMAFSALPANAGNAHGRDDNPGKAIGHAVNGGPATPGEKGVKGDLASAMGSLNAAHASFNGLEHADENSVVGALAAYMDALVSYEGSHPLYHRLIDEIGIVEDKIDAVEGEIDAVEGRIGDIEAEISNLSDQVAALDPEAENHEADEAALEDRIAALEADKVALEGDKVALEGEIVALEEDKVALQEDLDVVTSELNAAITSAAYSLEEAANKDTLIDTAVVEEVNNLLDGKSDHFTHSETIHDTEEDIAILIQK